MKRRVLLAAVMLGALCQGAWAQMLPVRELSIGLYKIQAEVAANEGDRERGLMNRKSLPTQAGMLFVFDSPAAHCFWMKNTLIPLSIAFIDQAGKIVSIDEMQAMSEKAHCPPKVVSYALEMNRGWFRAKNVAPGAQVEGLVR